MPQSSRMMVTPAARCCQAASSGATAGSGGAVGEQAAARTATAARATSFCMRRILARSSPLRDGTARPRSTLRSPPAAAPHGAPRICNASCPRWWAVCAHTCNTVSPGVAWVIDPPGGNEVLAVRHDERRGERGRVRGGDDLAAGLVDLPAVGLKNVQRGEMVRLRERGAVAAPPARAPGTRAARCGRAAAARASTRAPPPPAAPARPAGTPASAHSMCCNSGMSSVEVTRGPPARATSGGGEVERLERSERLERLRGGGP